jgi:hypothetical protein
VIDQLDAKPEAPVPPVDRKATAKYIDALRADGRRKRAAGWELVETVNACRAPILAAKQQ